MNQREPPQDEPENLNSQNQKPIHNNANPKNNTDKVPANIFNQIPSQPPAKIQMSSVLQEQVKDALKSVKLFNCLQNKSDNDYLQVQKIFLRHVIPHLQPRANTDVGEILLRNGQFVVAFIQVMTKKQKNNLLKNFLYMYFASKQNIVQENLYFQQQKKKALSDEQKLSLANSPGSSRNGAHWSTNVEKDSNSPMKSSVLESEIVKNFDKKLKRNTVAPFPQQANEQEDERPERAAKNATKNRKKSGNKSINKNNTGKGDIGNNKTKKPKQLAYKNSKSKSKNKTKYETDQKKRENKGSNIGDRNKGQKQGVSEIKRQTRSIKQLLQTNKNENQTEEQKLGSYFHYQISVHPKNKEQSVNLVRTSARISHKRSENSKSLNKSKKKNRDSKAKRTKKRTQQYQDDNDSDYTQGSESVTDLNEIISEDWIKQNFKLFKNSNVQLYSEFTALTENDDQIAALLREMENSQQAMLEKQNLKKQRKKTSHKKQEKIEEKKQDQVYSFQQISLNDDSLTEMRIMVPTGQQQKQEQIMSSNQKIASDEAKKQEEIKQRFKQFNKIKKQYQIGELPLTIQEVVDPNICGHGVFAFLRLGRITQFQLKTAYAISPLIFGASRKSKHINQSIDKAQKMAKEHNHNLGYIPINEQILQMVRQKNEELNSKPK